MSIENKNFNQEEFLEEKIIPMKDVPDWRFEPAAPLWEFGKKVDNFEILHSSEIVSVSPEIAELKEKLKIHESKTFFNGPFINIEGVSFKNNDIILKTKETDLFSYIAADYFYRDHQKDNPIRPLAVQSTIFSPGCDKIIIERRSKALTDMPDKLTVFGGALKLGEFDLKKAAQERLNKKWGLNVGENELTPTGFCRENVNNIYCAFYATELGEEQYKERKKWAREKMRAGEKMFYEVSTSEAVKSIEKILLGKRDITEWEPLGYYNILYALASRGLRSKEEIENLLIMAKEKIKEKQFKYIYPMEKYLENKR